MSTPTTTTIINELHNLRAMALTAHDAIHEVMDDGECVASSARVMGILAERALALANQIDAADLAGRLTSNDGGLPAEASGCSKEQDAAVLYDDVMYVDNLIQIAFDRSCNYQKDGKLVSLLDAAIPRLKRAREIAEKLQEARP